MTGFHSARIECGHGELIASRASFSYSEGKATVSVESTSLPSHQGGGGSSTCHDSTDNAKELELHLGTKSAHCYHAGG